VGERRDVEILGEDVVYRGPVYTIRQARLRYRTFGPDHRLSGGMSAEVRRIDADRGDAVAAIVLDTAARAVILTEQFRYPTLGTGTGWLREAVAGVVEPGEDPLAAIRREVREEIGYDLLEAHHIGTFYLSPGGSSERVILFYAEVDDALRVSQGGGVATEGEDIALRRLPVDELDAALERGEVADAKTLVGLLWLRDRLRRSG
jgi:nudix-type nucleoside diphosphatase (YffH/AdpP family)